jgi:hypothetical protein
LTTPPRAADAFGVGGKSGGHRFSAKKKLDGSKNLAFSAGF